MPKGKYQRIAMACQGGGALGAYHVGALKAMQEKGYFPDMIAGISIGAISAAIIAGNLPEERIQKLEEFWEMISWPDSPFSVDLNDQIAKIQNFYKAMQEFYFGHTDFWEGSSLQENPFLHMWKAGMYKAQNNFAAYQSLYFGQPNFYIPRWPYPEFSPPGSVNATSYYDTSPLKNTLLKLIDFDVLNSKVLGCRLLLGVTRVSDAKLIFFDSDIDTITPEHVMASGAMPPGFPGIMIDGELYWDGACSTNTPIESIFNAEPKIPTLCFMIDLYAPNGKLPETIDGVDLKKRELAYSSRTAHNIRHVRSRQNLAKGLEYLLDSLPPKDKKDPIIQQIRGMASDIHFDVVQVAYNKPDYESSNCRYEFSKTSIKRRAQQGYKDMLGVIEDSSWLKETPDYVGSVIHIYKGSKFQQSK